MLIIQIRFKLEVSKRRNYGPAGLFSCKRLSIPFLFFGYPYLNVLVFVVCICLVFPLSLHCVCELAIILEDKRLRFHHQFDSVISVWIVRHDNVSSDCDIGNHVIRFHQERKQTCVNMFSKLPRFTIATKFLPT